MTMMREYIERRMKLLPHVVMPLNRNGVRIDRTVQQKFAVQLRKKINNWRKSVDRHFDEHDLGEPPLGAKGGFSNKKMFKLLYEDLELPVKRHPGTASITANRDALKALEPLDETGTVSKLLERSEAKTAEVALQVKADSDGRVRSRFVFGGDEKSNQNEAGKESPGSGRLCSRGPNLQNIKEWVRMLYIPTHRSGWILKADYNQIELRLVAEFSGDENLQDALKEDAHLYIMNQVDVHSDLYGLHTNGWKKLNGLYRKGDVTVVFARDESKRITYGWCYRMGAKKLENVKGVPFANGKKALEALNAVFWRVPIWWDSLTVEMKRSAGGGEWGYLELPYGRRRYFLLSELPKICNFKPQGTAAEILYDAMMVLVPETPKRFPGSLAILTVHDEIVFDLHPSTDVVKFAAWVKEVMEQPVPEMNGLSIPVEIMVGRNWAKKHVCKNKNCNVPNNPDGQIKLEEWRRLYG
jgi:DNA polymerase-1